jgi:hypothetical protein
MGNGAVDLAYLESYAAVEYMMRNWDVRTMRRLCERLLRSPSLARALKKSYRASLDEIEAGLIAELR